MGTQSLETSVRFAHGTKAAPVGARGVPNKWLAMCALALLGGLAGCDEPEQACSRGDECEVEPDADDDDVTEANENETPHLDAVQLELETFGAGVVWERTADNDLGLDDSWLLQSPDCWGTDCSNAVGGMRLADAIAGDLSKATEWVDITTLITYPDGVFQEAIVDGLTTALEQNPNLTIRILGGTPPLIGNFASPVSESAHNYADRLREDLGPIADDARFVVAGMQTTWTRAWNHSKIIAVDSRTAIVGGHNLWTSVYMDVPDPVADVTMRLTGSAAESAHTYADTLWDFTCASADRRVAGQFLVDLDYSEAWGDDACPARHTTVAAPGAGSTPVLAVGGLGLGIADTNDIGSERIEPANDPNAACSRFFADVVNNDSNYTSNTDELALRALIESAQDSVFIAQQDLIAPCAPPIANFLYDARLFEILADKLIEGIPVQIVLSTPGAKQGSLNLPYSNASSFSQVTDVLLEKVRTRAQVSADEASSIVCSGLQLAPIRTGSADAWSDGHAYANHSKVIAVDGAAFYIGSKNLYPTILQDFGYIVEDAHAASVFEGELRSPMWNESQKDAVVDFTSGVCEL